MANEIIDAGGIKEISNNEDPAISIGQNTIIMDLNKLADLLIDFENRIKTLEGK